METLRVVTLFSGVDCQERGIENTGLFDIDVVATSDIDKDAIVSYASIHCGLTPELVNTYEQYPSREDMVKELSEKNIGYDFTKKKPYDWTKVERKKDKSELNRYWLAVQLSKNFGDISKVQTLPNCDLLTFSFPCTDISLSGKQKGLSYEDWGKGLNTRSGLVWEVVRLLKNYKSKNELPQYLLMENVANLVSKKFIGDFNYLNILISEIGYNVYWKVLNAKDCGVPQNRKRVFAVYIRKDIDKGRMTFPVSFDNGVRLKDILEQNVDDTYYLSDEICSRLVITDTELKGNIVGTTKPDFRTIGQRDNVYNCNGFMGALISTDYKQPKHILQGDKGNYRVRKLTPLEYFRLMGLEAEDMEKCRLNKVSNSSLYKQAGNGIVTDCIELIIEHLYQSQYNSDFVCFDELFSKPHHDKPKLIGGVGERNFGKQFRQGNRVYSSDHVAMCLTSQPLGNAGGFSYLYLVDDTTGFSPEPLIYTDYSPTLRANRFGLKVVEKEVN